MPSFDITSEADIVALKNAVDVAGRHIGNRYDFKGTSARVELNEKDKLITLHGDSEFQLGQIKDILFPEMEKKERESTKRLDHGPLQSVGGNKSKQVLTIKVGIEQELASGTLVWVPLTDKKLPLDRLKLVRRQGLGARPAVDAFIDIARHCLPST